MPSQSGPSSSLLTSLRESVERLTGRLVPRLRNLMDQRLDRLTETLDTWNRHLAEKALPSERRDKVAALSRGRKRRRLRVIGGRESRKDTGRSRKKI